MVRKLILSIFFLCVIFLLKTPIANAGPDDACEITTTPAELRANNLTGITFSNVRDAGTSLFVAFNTSNTGPCPLNSDNAGKFQEGCVSETILANPGESVTFNTNDLGDLRNLAAGTYTIRLCTTNDLDGTCLPACRSNNIVVKSASGGNPSPDPDGRGQGQSCQIQGGSEEYNSCTNGGRVRGNCATGLYCDAMTSGSCLEGTCKAGELTNDELKTNEPLSLPCAKNGQSYSDAKGCTRIKTALGFVRTDSNGFTKWLLGFVLSIAGGIVIIIIIVAGYKLMTSQGDPEKIKNARDQLTAAIIGLLFIIFSLAILELITRDILGLPGFGN